MKTIDYDKMMNAATMAIGTYTRIWNKSEKTQSDLKQYEGALCGTYAMVHLLAIETDEQAIDTMTNILIRNAKVEKMIIDEERDSEKEDE